MADKVSLIFENTNEIKPAEQGDLVLLSGPIELFATVDCIYEMDDDTPVVYPSQDDLENTEYYSQLTNDFDIDLYSQLSGHTKVSLYSPYVTKLAAANKASGKNTIIFVENVTGLQDDQQYRGAYFIFTGENQYDTECWQEILLGNHSHLNKKVLDSIEALDLVAGNGKVLVATENGFTLAPLEVTKELPELPEAVKQTIASQAIVTPIEYENHHLDATLDELKNTYDYLSKDKDGVYRNIAYGNCLDLYRALRESGNTKLYISYDNGECSVNTTSGKELSLEIFNVNFDTDNSLEEYLNAIQSPFDRTKVVIPFETKTILSDTNALFFFVDRDGQKQLLSDMNYQITYRDANKVTILLNKSDFSGIHPVTLLILKGNDVTGLRMNVAQAFINGSLNLDDINKQLLELYISDQIKLTPKLPRLYLTTDEKGRLSWENRLLPNQYFYAKTIDIDQEYINTHTEDNVLTIRFEGVTYHVADDFPILMIGEAFACDKQPDLNVNGAVVYHFAPTDGKLYDFDLEEGEVRKVTLVLIRNAASTSITETFDNKYITKEDAIAILSHGKLNLSDYASIDYLKNYAKINHIHSQYALVDHNHDFRYANFRHTHPELVNLMVKISNGQFTAEEITEWVERSKEVNLQDVISALSEYLDTQFVDTNIKITDPETIDKIDSLNDEYGIEKDLSTGIYVNDAINLMLQYFQSDTVLLSQVKLDKDIPVRLKNGPIGGLEKENVFKKGTSLEEILQIILNPYNNLDSVRKDLTPTNKSYFRWFTFIGGELVELNEKNKTNTGIEIPFKDEKAPLYFMPVLINEFGKVCQTVCVINEEDQTLKTVALIDENQYPKYLGEKPFEDDIYVYNSEFDFSTSKEPTQDELDVVDIDYDDITLRWTTNASEISNEEDGKIIDSYGTSTDVLTREGTDPASLTIDPTFEIELPYFYAGLTNVAPVDATYALPEEITPSYISREMHITLNQITQTPYLVIIIREDMDKHVGILDVNSDIALKGFMDKIENLEHSIMIQSFAGANLGMYDDYTCYYYDISSSGNDMNILIHVDDDSCKCTCKICR